MVRPKIIPVFGVDNFGDDKKLVVTETPALETVITFSTAAITQQLDSTFTNWDYDDYAIDKTDTGVLCGPANDTDYSTTMTFTPDMNAVIYKATLIMAFALNVSAFTSGVFNIGTITISAVERNTKRIPFQPITIVSGAANQGAVGTSIFIARADVSPFFKMLSYQPIDITIKQTVTRGVGTSQAGIVQYFPFIKTAQQKNFTQSGIRLHIHASLDHADLSLVKDIDRISPMGQL